MKLPDEFKTRDIERAGAIPYISLYNYIRLYENAGFVERVKKGNYRLTEKGKKAKKLLLDFASLCERENEHK